MSLDSSHRACCDAEAFLISTTVVSVLDPRDAPAVANGTMTVAPMYKNSSEISVQHLNMTQTNLYGQGTDPVM